jgi:hypothetical protein
MTKIDPAIKIIKPGTSHPAFDSQAMRWVQQLSKLLDSKFVIPGTNIRFGLDPIFSLIPVLGDLGTYFISAALIHTMYTHGASRKVVIKMMINATLDAMIGAIPIVGTVFDIFYRANDKNIRLLKEHYLEGKHQGSGNGILFLAILMIMIFIGGFVYGIWKLIEML